MALRFPQPRNCRIAILVAAVMTAVPVMAFAQNDPHIIPPPKQQKKLPEAPSKLPKVGADRTRGLDFLFGALKAAPDEASARHVEARIWALWMQTPSDTRSEEHTSELQSRRDLVCRLLLEKKKKKKQT